MILLKCYIQYVSKFGKLYSGHRTRKISFHFNPKEGQCQRMFQLPYNCIHFTCSKSFKLGFSSTWTENFQMYKLGFKHQRNKRSNWQHLLDHGESKGVPEKHLLLLYWLRWSLWLCGSQQTVENSERDGNSRPPYLPHVKPVCRSRSNS